MRTFHLGFIMACILLAACVPHNESLINTDPSDGQSTATPTGKPPKDRPFDPNVPGVYTGTNSDGTQWVTIVESPPNL